MRYLLDTNIVIYALKERAESLAKKLSQTAVTDLVTCSIVEAELYHGAMKYGVPHARVKALDEFLAPIQSLPFDSKCVSHYANIRDCLEREGRLIGGNDLLIAAIALANGLIVVSHNCEEFRRVPELAVEDWVNP